jgi:hypothetical protein
MAALIVIGLLLAAFCWFIWGGGDDPDRTDRHPNPDIDRAELEEAEREVREAPDAESVRDWGPGTGKPKPPETP